MNHKTHKWKQGHCPGVLASDHLELSVVTSGVGEKWSYLGYIQKVELTQFADGLNMGCDENREDKITPKFLACSCHLLKTKKKVVWQESQEFGNVR